MLPRLTARTAAESTYSSFPPARISLPCLSSLSPTSRWRLTISNGWFCASKGLAPLPPVSDLCPQTHDHGAIRERQPSSVRSRWTKQERILPEQDLLQQPVQVRGGRRVGELEEVFRTRQAFRIGGGVDGMGEVADAEGA